MPLIGALAIGMCAALGACALTPAYRTPALPAPQVGANYAETSPPAQTASSPVATGAAQRFHAGDDIPAQWWTLLRSPDLDAMVKQALARNPSLGAAQAALRQAQENYSSVSGSLQYPAVTANLQGGRQQVSALNTGGPQALTYNLLNASVNVSYTLDVFGANRKSLEAQAAAVDIQRYQLEASYLTLTSNVVTTAIREALLRAQIQTTQELLQAQIEQLNVISRQVDVGAASLVPLLAQRSTVSATRAQLPALQSSLAQVRHQLAVLVGELPSQGGRPAIELDALTLPQDLPVSLPGDLVRQRPDVRASEAQLHQAAALLGVATANLYPQFTLSGSLGSQATSASQLFERNWNYWSLLGGLTQPLFDGGALSAKKRAAQAGYEVAAHQYRSTVLQAYENVADSLKALEFDALTLQQQVEAERVARQSLDLNTQQYRLGAVSYLSLLDAQRAYQQARLSLVSARAARLADTAALFQALGGGWWNRSELPDVPVAAQAQPH